MHCFFSITENLKVLSLGRNLIKNLTGLVSRGEGREGEGGGATAHIQGS